MKTFDNIDAAYRDLIGPLTSYAVKHIYNRDLKFDVVHDAFAKTLKYLQKHPDAKISEFILKREVIRACRRVNKYSVEVPSSHTFDNLEKRSNEQE